MNLNPVEKLEQLEQEALKVRPITSVTRERIRERGIMDYDWKLRVLEEIAMEGENGDRIRAISEANKMQGHYAAEKLVTTNFNVDTDIQSGIDLVQKQEDALAKYRRDL